MLNLRAELLSLHYQFDDTAMVELMLNTLPHTYEFESLRSRVRYNSADTLVSPERARDELLRPRFSLSRVYQAKSGRRNSKSGGSKKQKTEGNEDQHKGSKSKDTTKKVIKSFVCESTEHLIAGLLRKSEKSRRQWSRWKEQQRKKRANMTTRVEYRSSSDRDHEETTLAEVNKDLDAKLIDSRLPIESPVNI